MGWLKEKQKNNKIVLSIGPYIAPRHVYIVHHIVYLIGTGLFIVALLFLLEIWLNPDRAYRFFGDFVKPEWVYWMIKNPLQVFLGGLAAVIIASRIALISDRIALLILGKYRKVTFTANDVRVHQLFSLYKSRRREESITFELVAHPRAEEMAEKQMRAMSAHQGKGQPNYFKKAGIVTMRSGTRNPVRVACIYDWKPIDLEHKAQELVRVLQALLNKDVATKAADENADFFGERV